MASVKRLNTEGFSDTNQVMITQDSIYRNHPSSFEPVKPKIPEEDSATVTSEAAAVAAQKVAEKVMQERPKNP